MKPPHFWAFGKENLYAHLLRPLSWIYGTVSNRRANKIDGWMAPIPVICVGNLIIGGAGKTPTALALAEKIIASGGTPFFLSRGYGGSFQGPVIVNSGLHSALQVGDEPLLLARVAPVCVAKNRQEGAALCVKNGATHIIMDDGFQNPGLLKDLSILVIDGGFGVGNQQVFPAGPLRETFKNGVMRANAVLFIGVDRTGILPQIKQFRPDLPILHGHIKSERPHPHIEGQSLMAFAGIGRPEKFYDSLRDQGAHLVETVDFDDHHPYTNAEISELVAQADAKGVRLFTTEKDLVRCPSKFKNRIETLKIHLEWEEQDVLNELLLSLTTD